MNRPILAITLGDVAGIGPEVVLKALAREEASPEGKCIRRRGKLR